MTEPIRAFPPRTVPVARRSSWVLRTLFVIVILAIVLEGAVVAGLVGFTFLRLTDEHEPTSNVRPQPIVRQVVPDFTRLVSRNANVWDGHGPINVLLLGLDEDDCLHPEGTYRRTDTIIIVRVDPQTKRVSMMTVPRDLYVSVPINIDGERRMSGRKINTAHLMGEKDATLTGGGPELVKETIEINLGIPIHRYARIDYQGFKRIVDALGGVEIDIPPSRYDPTVGLYDPKYPDGHCGTMSVTLKPGLQHLDGDEALQYARSRSTTSDFDRSRRQMEVLIAIRQKAASMDLIAGLPEGVPALLDTVDTDFSLQELFSLARTAKDIEPADIATFQIDETTVYDDWLIIDDVPQAVLRLQPDAFELIRQKFLALGAEEVTTSVGADGGVN